MVQYDRSILFIDVTVVACIIVIVKSHFVCVWAFCILDFAAGGGGKRKERIRKRNRRLSPFIARLTGITFVPTYCTRAPQYDSQKNQELSSGAVSWTVVLYFKFT